MSLKSDNKSTRNGQVILNDEKKRSSENKSNFKKIIEKKSQKEDGKKEKKINWEEEKDVIESYFRQRHPMISERKRNKIIEEKAEKYIDLEEYKTFFLKYQTKKLADKLKSRKLSNASDNVKSYFDLEAKESYDYSSSDDDDDENINDDQESENTKPNYEEAEGEEEDEEESSITRKRKDENCNLEEPSSKKSKKSDKINDWLPNGDKVNDLRFVSK